jgi:gluconolactonase
MTRVIAENLAFPEGPVAMSDGSILLVEIKRQTLSRVRPDGRIEVVASLGGGPNGAAIGPDGQCYVCNNGGFQWHELDGVTLPGGPPEDYAGGWVERVDLTTGKVERLYDNLDGRPLRGPNDLVFDGHGGFWFSDLGKGRTIDLDRGAIYYAKADGSVLRRVIRGVLTPNGIGLSPDGRTLYAAETETGRVWAWDIVAPGEIAPHAGHSPNGGRMLYASPSFVRFDSLAVDAAGNICVATIHDGGITVVSPQGGRINFVPVPQDWMVTNICFGGPEMRKAYVTCSGQGLLLELDWPTPGLTLAHSR